MTTTVFIHRGFRAEKVAGKGNTGWDIFHGTFNCGWVAGNKTDARNLIDEIIKQREVAMKGE
jgi:hypothetical protein